MHLPITILVFAVLSPFPALTRTLARVMSTNGLQYSPALEACRVLGFD